MLLAFVFYLGIVYKAKIEAEDKGEYKYNKDGNKETLVAEAVMAPKVLDSDLLLLYGLGQVFYHTLHAIFNGGDGLMLASYQRVYVGEESRHLGYSMLDTL